MGRLGSGISQSRCEGQSVGVITITSQAPVVRRGVPKINSDAVMTLQIHRKNGKVIFVRVDTWRADTRTERIDYGVTDVRK